jgi:hypothetical protein
MAYGRGAVRGVASRYTTVLVWSSALALLSLGELLRTARRRRAVAVIAAVTIVLLAHADAAQRSLDLVRSDSARRRHMAANVRDYMRRASRTERLAEPLPYPSREILEQHLDDPANATFLPSEWFPRSVSWQHEGDAWTENGEYPNPAPVPAPSLEHLWGSWSGGDAHTGRLQSEPLHVVRPLLIVPIAGYPAATGDVLHVRRLDQPRERAVFAGADPGERWEEWTVDVSRWIDHDIQITAVDGRREMRGWLGVGAPMQTTRGVRWLGLFLARLETLAAALAVGALSLWLWHSHAPEAQATAEAAPSACAAHHDAA